MAPSAYRRAVGRVLRGGGALGLSVAVAALPRLLATAASSWNPALLVNTEAFQVIDESDADANVQLRFGSTLNATLSFDRAADRFDFSKSLYVRGNLTLTGALKVTSITASGGVAYMSGSRLLGTPTGASGQLLISRGTAAPAWTNPVGGMVWYIDGTLSAAAGVGAQVTLPFGITLSEVTLNIKGPPAGAALIVDVNKNGASLFSTRPQVDAGAVTGGTTAVYAVTDLPAGALMTLDIDQVGSTFAGSGLTVILKGYRRY